MSSVCGGLDFKDAESHLESSSASSPSKCSNGSKHGSSAGSEDAPESDGDNSGYKHQQNVNEDRKDDEISKPIPQSSPRISLDDESEEKNLATALQDMFSESMREPVLIPAIKGGREKHGKSLKKLNVSWAEDVYDPPPSIVSHTRKKNQQPHKSKSKDNMKKNGKKGQKGSSSSKDKKQSSSSRSNKYNRDKFNWTSQSVIAASS